MEGMVMKEFWSDRPMLITGASGFLGGWLVRRLLELQADVVCLVRDWVPESELIRSRLMDRVKVIRGHVQNQSLLERVLGEYEIRSVIHLAAQTIVPIAFRNPASTWATNVGGTWALLEACRRSPTVEQIVLASSDKAYGPSAILPYSEEMSLQGRHPYDASKSCADLIGQSYAATYGLPIVISRCGNIYGGGDLNWSRIVPGTIRSVLRGRRPVVRSDGNGLRDYFYVEDTVAAYLLLVERLAKNRDLAGQAFNFSYETAIPVWQLVHKILRLMDSPLIPDIRNEAAGEIRHQYLSAAKARQVLGWQPTFSLDEGLRQTIAWYRDFLGETEEDEWDRTADPVAM